MRTWVRQSGIDVAMGSLAVAAAAFMGAVIGGIAVLWGFPVYFLWEVVSMRFRDDLGTTNYDPIDFYVNVVGVWIWVIVGTLTALGLLGRLLRADRKPVSDHPG